MSILTPHQCKAARSTLGLSQNMVSKGTGINRTTLGLFEVGKYLLDDRTLRTLREYYESQGYSIEEARIEPSSLPSRDLTPPQETGVQPFDGFLVPTGLDAVDVEDLLAEIADNDERIAALGAQPVKRHWFTDDLITESRDEALQLMARNYHLIRTLQGHEQWPAANDDEDEAKSVWDMLRSLIAGKH